MPKSYTENPTKALRRDRKRKSKQNQTTHHGRSSLRYREQAERKRNRLPNK